MSVFLDRLFRHPGLTITTYTVNPKTGEQTAPAERRHHARPNDMPLQGSIWPPCECPRHRRAG